MDSTVNQVKVNVQPRSGFDKSFMSIGAAKTGQIVPILCDEVLPNSKINLKLAMNVNLPPLANDVYMRCALKTEAFFVPSRLLVGSFQNWFTGVSDTVNQIPARLPFLSFEPGDSEDVISLLNYMNKSDRLFDWLGYRFGHVNEYDSTVYETDMFPSVSLLPFLAYHKIYDDWYRKTLIQRPVFCRPEPGATVLPSDVKYYPYVYVTGETAEIIAVNSSNLGMSLNDGHQLFSLRQRNFGDDPYMVATTSPQLGDAQSVRIANNNFTIAALRAANSMQEFEEFNQLAGSRFQDQLRVRYGASLSDGVAQRCLFLGSGSFDVYSKGVYQTVEGAQNPRNPYNSVGSRYGSAYAAGSEFIITNFHAQEPGYIFVMASLVPRRSYQNGASPVLTKYVGSSLTSAVMGNAVLQNVGPQSIDASRLGGHFGELFGYEQRFSEYMYRTDEVHSALRKGGKLQYFALSEYIEPYDSLEISSNFLKIPTYYLDSIFAVAPAQDEPHYWFDVYFDYKVSQPLAKYSIPSLQNPAYEHGDTITIKRGGISL